MRSNCRGVTSSIVIGAGGQRGEVGDLVPGRRSRRRGPAAPDRARRRRSGSRPAPRASRMRAPGATGRGRSPRSRVRSAAGSRARRRRRAGRGPRRSRTARSRDRARCGWRAGRSARPTTVRPGRPNGARNVDTSPGAFATMRVEGAAVVRRVGAEAVRGLVDVAVQRRGATAVEGMREWERRVDPLHAVRLEVELGERGRRDAERLHRGAHVVHVARLGERLRPQAAADRRARLEQHDAAAGARQGDRGDEPVRARTDDDGVVRQWSWRPRAVRSIAAGACRRGPVGSMRADPSRGGRGQLPRAGRRRPPARDRTRPRGRRRLRGLRRAHRRRRRRSARRRDHRHPHAADRDRRGRAGREPDPRRRTPTSASWCSASTSSPTTRSRCSSTAPTDAPTC